MAFYETQGGKVVPYGEDVPAEAVVALERADDASIISHMTTGEAGEAYIYRYNIQTKAGPREIIGISVDGAKEIAQQVKNLETLPDVKIDKDSDSDYCYAMVRVRNLATNVTLLGVGRQCKFVVDSGNRPLHERNDEHWFVKAISKAQRNGILGHVSQEIIVNIIQKFGEQGKSRRVGPPTVATQTQSASRQQVQQSKQAPAQQPSPKSATTVTPEITPEMLARQEEKLKQMRQDIAQRLEKELLLDADKRKIALRDRFGVDSLLQLSESQLKDCNEWISQIMYERRQSQPSSTPGAKPTQEQSPQKTPEQLKDETAIKLGFTSYDNQLLMRRELYNILTQKNMLGLSEQEASEFIKTRGFAKTLDIPKDRMAEFEQEVKRLIAIKNEPAPIPENKGEPEI